MTTTPEFLNLGKQAYAETYEQMRSLVQGKSFKDQIWLLEHPSIFTLGTAADISHVLNPGDIPCLLYTSPSPRDMRRSRMPSSA